MEGEGLRREEDGLQGHGRARIVVVGAALLEDQTKTRNTLSSSDERPVGKWAELEEAAFAKRAGVLVSKRRVMKGSLPRSALEAHHARE